MKVLLVKMPPFCWNESIADIGQFSVAVSDARDGNRVLLAAFETPATLPMPTMVHPDAPIRSISSRSIRSRA